MRKPVTSDNASNAALLIGLDLGTTALKGLLMNRQGDVLAESHRDVSFLHPHQDWVEVDPLTHYSDLCDIIRELASAAPGPVAALAMAAASGNTLLTDRTGVPLTNIINWMDRRSGPDVLDALKVNSAGDIHHIVGWPYIGRFPLAHLAWLKENQPELYRAADHVCMNTDWVLARLTGQWQMDHSTATTFYLQDQLTREYRTDFLSRLEIPASKLSALCPSGCAVGPLAEEALAATSLPAGATAVSGCFDHPAAARAFGLLRPGQLMLSCGTSWVGFFPELDRDRIIEAELLCDPYLSGRNGPWGAIFSVPCIGRSVDWYVENVIANGEPDGYRVFNELAAESEPGAGGLVIDLTTEPRHIGGDRKHISRAVMEGAANLLNARIRSLHSRGISFDSAVMVGGPTKSPIWPGIVQEITGIELQVGSRHAGAKGAAMLAGIGVGMFENERDAYLKAGD